MQQVTLTVYAIYLTQAAAAVVLAVLLARFYVDYSRRYLLYWSWSWVALAVFHLAGAIGLALAHDYPPDAPIRLLTILVSSSAGYAQIGLLLFGTIEIAKQISVSRRKAAMFLLALVGVGIITALLFSNDGDAARMRYLLRVGLRAFTAGVAFLASAFLLWKYRWVSGRLGFRLVSVAFFIYGLEQLHYTGAVLYSVAIRSYATYVVYLGFVDFTLLSLMGLGMVTSLLEDERQAVEQAGERITHIAYHDPLTGLPNRTLFADELLKMINRAARRGERLALLFLDLDRFKDINDSLGHSVGDDVLRSVAEQIRSCCSENDLIARFGTDEFTVAIANVVSVDDAAKQAHRILETLRVPVRIRERELSVPASMGICIYPDDGADPETLIRNSDTAMYRAKELGGNNYQLYSPGMSERALERLALDQMLRRAIGHDELCLFYQPLVDLATETPYGFEALLRWRHPQLGLLSPAHFISVAELSGAIVEIGDWALVEACRQIRIWQKRFDRELVVSVNLSARQFEQEQLLGSVRRALRQSGIEPRTLELEITESNAMQNAENTLRTLGDLKKLGVRIAMDDFGTGYSSLSYLNRFPIDTLKLDQSFLRGIGTEAEDTAIARAVLAMAESMRLDVVAEGVETAAQAEFLRAHRCRRAQGYLFSRPLPPEDLERWFDEKSRATEAAP